MKTCPFCAEQIQDPAIKCRHCGSILNTDGTAGGPGLQAPARRKQKSPSSAPVTTLGRLLVFIALWLLLTGGSEFYAGSSTRDLARGTVLEHDQSTNVIVSNVEASGAKKVGLGLVLLLFGGALATMTTARPAPALAPAGSPRDRIARKNSFLSRRDIVILVVALLALIGASHFDSLFNLLRRASLPPS